jgi:hypothetical protein
MKTRRKFLKAAASSMMLPGAMISAAEAAPQTIAGSAFPHSSNDEASFVRWYDVDRGMVNLENAYWNVMARPVMEEYRRQTQFVNRVNIPFLRGVVPSQALPLSCSKCDRRWQV